MLFFPLCSEVVMGLAQHRTPFNKIMGILLPTPASRLFSLPAHPQVNKLPCFGIAAFLRLSWSVTRVADTSDFLFPSQALFRFSLLVSPCFSPTFVSPLPPADFAFSLFSMFFPLRILQMSHSGSCACKCFQLGALLSLCLFNIVCVDYYCSPPLAGSPVT